MSVDGPLADRPATEPVRRRGPSATTRDRALRLLAAPVVLALAVAVLVTGSSARSAPAPALTVVTAPAAGGALATSAPVPVLGRADVPRPVTHEILGFLPYWKLDAETGDDLHYDLLTTIAFFGIGIRRDGALDTTKPGYRAYMGQDAATITDRAHAEGVRVVPTFQLFDRDSLPTMTTFLGDMEARDRFIEAALALLAERRADGAVLDFEPLPARLTDEFAAFAADFGRALHAADPTSQLTVAMHQSATDAQVASVAGSVDRIFVMAYDYHWRGSVAAGPVAPIDGLGADVRTTLDRFVADAGARRVILGVPYYGYDWPVLDAGPGAAVRTPASEHGGSWSVGYVAAVDFLRAHPSVERAWDPVAMSPHFTYRDAASGTYREVWYDDARSLAIKYLLAKRAGVAGVGIWALGMDRGRDELWELLRTSFGKQ
ncbi:MAG: glycosyl hydrolase family 18 protein [Chloroflexota bacterium]